MVNAREVVDHHDLEAGDVERLGGEGLEHTGQPLHPVVGGDDHGDLGRRDLLHRRLAHSLRAVGCDAHGTTTPGFTITGV
jgi:hypothetical protein